MNHNPGRRQFAKRAALSAVGLWAAGRCQAADAGDDGGLSADEFARLHRELQPPADEPWRTIPWRTSLADACRLAAREKKPLVMRVRSGHPLGCV